MIASSYPYPGFPFSGIFNERAALALKRLCEHVEVLAPRPIVPPFLKFHPKWKRYSTAQPFEISKGIQVNRPGIPVLPKIRSSVLKDSLAYRFSLGCIRKLNKKYRFNAILGFDLLNSGGLAWRAGEELGIPASCWAIGSDTRVSVNGPFAGIISRVLNNLDLVFYQSRELFEVASAFLKKPGESARKHIVLPRGIERPPRFDPEKRRRTREAWGFKGKEIVVLWVGRMTREKGIFDFLRAASVAAGKESSLRFIALGSIPEFDQTREVLDFIESDPKLKKSVKLEKACPPSEIWDKYAGADIFAFTSHNEGMPNTLLEAMGYGLPSVSFSIPPIMELDSDGCSLMKIRPFETGEFANSLLKLACSPPFRSALGAKGAKLVNDKYLIEKSMSKALFLLRGLVASQNNAGQEINC